MNRDKIYLLHIRDNIAKIKRLAKNGKDAFLADEDEQAAILYYIQTLSESTSRLSDDLRNQHSEIAWQQIKGFRNRVVHEYLSIDLELVWLIITVELQPLLKAINEMLEKLEDSNEDSEEN